MVGKSNKKTAGNFSLFTQAPRVAHTCARGQFRMCSGAHPICAGHEAHSLQACHVACRRRMAMRVYVRVVGFGSVTDPLGDVRCRLDGM